MEKNYRFFKIDSLLRVLDLRVSMESLGYFKDSIMSCANMCGLTSYFPVCILFNFFVLIVIGKI